MDVLWDTVHKLNYSTPPRLTQHPKNVLLGIKSNPWKFTSAGLNSER